MGSLRFGITEIVFRVPVESPEGDIVRHFQPPSDFEQGKNEDGVWFWEDRDTRIFVPWSNIAWTVES